MNGRLKVFFVFRKNTWRSPTAEKIYRNDARMSVRSRGTLNAAARPIRNESMLISTHRKTGTWKGLDAFKAESWGTYNSQPFRPNAYI